METTPQHPDVKPLSASRVKTFENCSWLYHCTYILKLPQFQNDGARKGEVCHSVFEMLLNPKHNRHYKKILKADSVAGSIAVERLIKKLIKKIGLSDDLATFVQIDRMILVGFKTDFHVKGGKIVSPEYKFDLVNESPQYHIKGYIDKPAIRGNNIIIDDFKSSKKKFEGEEEESNLQALFYSLAAFKIWPDLKPIVRFIFLQFPNDPLITIEFSKDTLKGFEYYLGDMQKRINNFSAKDAERNFAADHDQKGKEFSGKLLCGFAKSPGQKKKDGSPMWHCPYKFPFQYFLIKKASGEVARSVLKKEDAKLQAGETIEFMKYAGCPKYNDSKNVLDEFTTPSRFSNVLDDF